MELKPSSSPSLMRDHERRTPALLSWRHCFIDSKQKSNEKASDQEIFLHLENSMEKIKLKK